MNPLISLSALLNVGISSRSPVVVIRNSRPLHGVLEALLANNLISGYNVLSKTTTVFLRYSNGQPPFKGLKLASSGGRLLYVTKGSVLRGSALISSSVNGVCLSGRIAVCGGKILFFITF